MSRRLPSSSPLWPSSSSPSRHRHCRRFHFFVVAVVVTAATSSLLSLMSKYSLLLRHCCGLGHTPEHWTELACWRDRRLSVGAKQAAQRQEASGETVASRGNRTVAPRKIVKGGSRTEGHSCLEEQETREGGGGGDRGIHMKEVHEDQRRIEGTTIS